MNFRAVAIAAFPVMLATVGAQLLARQDWSIAIYSASSDRPAPTEKSQR